MNPEPENKAVCLPEKKKMEALGRLSCKVAHDFNNILGAIEGYATLALSGLKKDDSLAQDLQEIRAAVAKAAALGKQLIVFGGRQLLHKAPCEAGDIIAAALKRPELATGGGFSIEVQVESGLPALLADARQLEQALSNLLVNAREAMPAGGVSSVAASLQALEGAAVRSPNPGEAGQRFIKISVRDSGAGVSVEAFEHLFEPLFSTSKKSLGSGFGLSTVYGTVKQHNGWVEVKSEPGRGSEFAVFLSAAPAEA